MKKVLGLLLVLSVFVLAGCEQGEDLVNDIQELGTDITDITIDLSDIGTDLEAAKEDLEDVLSTNTEMETTVNDLGASLQTLQEEFEVLQEENTALRTELDTTNAKIKNALDRENWTQRKVKYNPDYTSYEAEYCLGVFDEDWSSLTIDDYTYNGGLKFVITVEEIVWGTEMFVKDSCGNYSVFLYQSSPYALYSVPAGMFEVGKTYEVVLYKDTYFTVPQLGLLPVVEMGDFGAYPEDISGIIVTEVE